MSRKPFGGGTAECRGVSSSRRNRRDTDPKGVQIPPAGAMGTLKRRDTNTPAPNPEGVG